MSPEDQIYTIKWLKDTRKGLDTTLQDMKDIQNTQPALIGRNLSISITELENAIMRLGMCLKDMDTPNPYPNSMDSSNTKIDPTADGLKL